MEYFDKKEDVMDLELTPFGEALLAKGDFKPEYYAFFDDEVLYDANYASITTEKQNQTKKRIKETPRLMTQYQFRGSEFPKYITQKIIEQFPDVVTGTPAIPMTWPTKGTKKMCGLIDAKESFIKKAIIYSLILPSEEFQIWYKEKFGDCEVKAVGGHAGTCPPYECWDEPTINPGSPGSPGKVVTTPGGMITEHLYPNPNFDGNALPLPLGHCKHETEFAPAWDISFLYGRTTEPINMLTSTMHPYLRIPQINTKVIYESRVGPTDKTKEVKEKVIRLTEYEEIHTYDYKFSDGTYIDFDEDYFVLDINEHNVPFNKENYEIEVFKIEKVPRLSKEGKAGFEDTLIPLSFRKPLDTIVDNRGLLKSLDNQLLAQEQEIESQMSTLDDSFVEHYFNIWVDDEIEEELMCQVKPVNKKRGVFTADPWNTPQTIEECATIKSDFSIQGVYPEHKADPPECDE